MGVFLSDMDMPGVCSACEFYSSFYDAGGRIHYCNRLCRELTEKENADIPDDCPVCDAMEYTLQGYDLPTLNAFAYACRRNGVTENDLKKFATNCEEAFKLVFACQQEQLEKTLKAFEKKTISTLKEETK